jgi:MoxR-like ATPase
VAAALDGRSYVVPSDVQALTRPVLGHRVILTSGNPSGPSVEEIIDDIVGAIDAPPTDHLQ